MELDGDINIIEAYEPEEERRQVSSAPELGNMPSGVMSASPDQIQEMMETVNNLQGTLDERKAEMDKIARPDGG